MTASDAAPDAPSAPVHGRLGLVVSGLGKTWRGKDQPVFADIGFELARNGRLGLLGRNGQGKSTLIRILGGALPASRGVIDWRMSASWPIGFQGGFQGSLTGLDNIRFIARLYDRDKTEALERVEAFAELGAALREPVRHYSSGMRARLAFGLSLAIDFDCHLIDELVSVGDARFQDRCREELFGRRADRAFIMASHDLDLIRRECDQALVLENGSARLFADVDEAIAHYRA